MPLTILRQRDAQIRRRGFIIFADSYYYAIIFAIIADAARCFLLMRMQLISPAPLPRRHFLSIFRADADYFADAMMRCR